MDWRGRSATCAIEIARRGCGCLLADAGFHGRQRHAAVFEYEAGDAHEAHLPGGGKSGVGVAQLEERLEVSHVGADVNDMIVRVSLDLRLNAGAVRTGVHYKYGNHGSFFFLVVGGIVGNRRFHPIVMIAAKLRKNIGNRS